MWQKVRSLWREIYTRFGLESRDPTTTTATATPPYDFFFLGGDDVYLLPGNLRRLLAARGASASEPLYLGRNLQGQNSDHGLWYQSGGAGYVLSREALRRLVEEGLESSFCRPRQSAFWEDVNVGHCMRFLGVEAAETSDAEGRQTFHYQSPGFLGREGRTGEVSAHSVSFHYIRDPRDMRFLHTQLYGCEDSAGRGEEDLVVSEE